MTTALILKSFLELAFICLLIYGFAHEDKVIAFEQKVWRILFVNYRRYRRKKRYAKMQKNRDFRVVDGGSTSTQHKRVHSTTHVA
ncbi:MAG: hypothetical protein ACI4K9_07705 [Candidatus Fimenecus sp.]